jgi:hypothetical protein
MKLVAKKGRPESRRAIASAWALVVLSVLAVFSVAISGQFLSGRHWLERRQEQVQALWLARSGIEFVEAGLLSDPDKVTGEMPDLLPGWGVHIEVRKEKELSGTYTITSEARFPPENSRIRRSLTRQVRRISEKGNVRMEVVAPMPPNLN